MLALDLNGNDGYEDASVFEQAVFYLKRTSPLSVASGNRSALRHTEVLHTSVPLCLQLGDYISDIASNMMLVEEHVLWMAQNEARACTRIVQCVERIADLSLTGDNQVISKVSANIALEAFLIRPSNFLGLSCTALQRPPPSSDTSLLPDGHSHSDQDKIREGDAAGESLLNFKCHTVNNSASPASQLSKLRPRHGSSFVAVPNAKYH
ncbi:hypothetical protein NQZ68_012546 [Dissostichus eleginoides]|nr:hypothetical protein NQZ68_012546 [Dissostichus eleginoides]